MKTIARVLTVSSSVLALLAGGVPLNLINLSKFTVVFILIYIIIWYCSYHKAVKDVKSINQKIKEK